MKPLTNTIPSIKNRVIDNSLLAFTITFLPISIVNILRAFVSGWTLQSYALPFVIFAFISGYLFRKRLEYNVKVFILLLGLVGNSIVTLYSYGLLSMGIPLLLTATALSGILTNRRISTILIIINSSIIVIFRFLVTQNKIDFIFEIEPFFFSPTTWNGQVLGYLTLAFVLILMSRTVMDKFTMVYDNLNTINYHYKLAFDTSQDIIFCINSHKTLLSVNHSFEKITGKSSEELVGKQFSTIYASALFDTYETQNIINKSFSQVIDSNFAVKLTTKLRKFRTTNKLLSSNQSILHVFW